MLHIKVPATSANMGPGFDCIGIAFKLYNHIWIEERDNGLVIESKNGSPDVPRDSSNLIYRSMQSFHRETGILRTYEGLRLVQEDYIPMTGGLGSSAACIVGGLMAANGMSGSRLDKNELAELAAAIEGHPDNSTPAIMGGMVVGAITMNNGLEYIKLDLNTLTGKGVRFGVMIPEFQLPTEKARSVLPDSYLRKDVVFNVSRAALMVAAVMSGDKSKLKTAMEDCVHQPYRSALVPHMNDIFSKAAELGALGVFLSGAGSALCCLYDDDNVRTGLKCYLAQLPGGWDIRELEPDNEGAKIEGAYSLSLNID